MLPPPLLYPFSAEMEQQGPAGRRKNLHSGVRSPQCAPEPPQQPPGSPVPLSGYDTREGGRGVAKRLITSGGSRHACVSTAPGCVGSPVLQITQQTTKCRKHSVFRTLESLWPSCTWAVPVVSEVSSTRGTQLKLLHAVPCKYVIYLRRISGICAWDLSLRNLGERNFPMVCLQRRELVSAHHCCDTQGRATLPVRQHSCPDQAGRDFTKILLCWLKGAQAGASFAPARWELPHPGVCTIVPSSPSWHRLSTALPARQREILNSKCLQWAAHISLSTTT